MLERSTYSTTIASPPGTTGRGGECAGAVATGAVGRGAAGMAAGGRCVTDPDRDERLSAARFSPQHPIGFTSLQLVLLDDDRLWLPALEETRSPGEREPRRDQLTPLPRDDERGRRRHPDAQTLEAVHRPSRNPVAEPRAEPHDGVGGAILPREQMRHPPRRKRGNGEVGRAGVLHRPAITATAPAGRCRCRSARCPSPRDVRRRGWGRSTYPRRPC